MKNFKNYISLISEETRIPEHLVERFLTVKDKVHQISELLAEVNEEENQTIQKVKKISEEIIEEL